MISMWFILRDLTLFGMTKSALSSSATLVISAISKSPFGSFLNSDIGGNRYNLYDLTLSANDLIGPKKIGIK